MMQFRFSQELIYFLNLFLKLSPKIRRLILVLLDNFCLFTSIFLSFLFTTTRLQDTFFIYSQRYLWIFPAALIFSLIIFTKTGQYKGLTRFVGSIDAYAILLRNLLVIFAVLGFGFIFNQNIPHLSLFVLIWLLSTSFLTFLRFSLKDILLKISLNKNKIIKPIAIYGAGEAGAQLCDALHRAQNHKVVFFIDDNSLLWGRSIMGIKIYPPHKIPEFSYKVEQILLAIPSLSSQKRRLLLKRLCKWKISVLEIPSLNNLTLGKASIDNLLPIKVEDLLGRSTVLPCQELLGPGIYGSNVCITGAGGSIGSELCVEILKLRPKKIIIIDHCEYSLYSIEQKLNNLLDKSSISIISVLGSCTESKLINKVFKENKVEIVFHAAAYKHVPLVEKNPIVGIINNVLSTRILCQESLNNGINKFILISTDKAVRPTNVMGATKRLSELIVQGYALDQKIIKSNSKSDITLFSMVRFGNVLGSSGSVVPRFERQIANGGPITLTHEKVVRYFMTIKEAAQLVIQSSVLSDGGDVFLLDMGEPILIKDLAMQMINLSGLTIKDKENPKGDIEIICTGLRPGEKLYEELLIEDNSTSTIHPLIYRAQENFINPSILWPTLNKLENHISKKEDREAINILKDLIPEWTSS